MKIKRTAPTRPSFPIFWVTIVIGVSFCSFHTGYSIAKLKYATSTQHSSNTVADDDNVKLTSLWEVSTPPAVDKDITNDVDCSEYEYPPTPAPAPVLIPTTRSSTGEEIFYNTAIALKPGTDKVTKHMYQIMYGRFLIPYYDQNPTMKMLEIGLGCDMHYGPGASVAVWKKLFPKADLWEAEFDAGCVTKHREGVMLKGINLLTGDQGNDVVLDSWIETSGGNFDVVIDDGGHHNCQIWHSFQKLWPTVKPGGLYFMEDMHVGKLNKYRTYTTDTCGKDFIVVDKLKEYLDVMIHHDQRKEFAESDIEFIFCQYQACVLGKKK